jgi:hypothetical protein
MAARPQWYFASMGFTNKVQPYCRFATAAMQMTPITSWIHGLASGDFVVVTEAGFALMIFPLDFLVAQTCLGDAERRAIGCTRFAARYCESRGT